MFVFKRRRRATETAIVAAAALARRADVSEIVGVAAGPVGLPLAATRADPAQEAALSDSFFDDFENSCLESFEVGEEGVVAAVTNAVSRCFVAVQYPWGELLPVEIKSEALCLFARERLQIQPKNDKFCSLSVTTEWPGVLKGSKNIMYERGRIQSPSLRSDMKAVFNAHALAKFLTDVTGVAVLLYGLHMTNHVCAFRAGWRLDLRRIRSELRGLQNNRADSSKKEFPAEMVRPYKHYPDGHRLRSVLIMFFAKGAVNIIGIRHRSDYRSVAEAAMKICRKYRVLEAERLALTAVDVASAKDEEIEEHHARVRVLSVLEDAILDADGGEELDYDQIFNFV